jgi:hypothetical protein
MRRARSAVLRRALTVSAATGALVALLAGPAAASVPREAAPQLAAAVAPTVVPQSEWATGTFQISGAPVVRSAPDGWLCHVGIYCRPGVLAPQGLEPEDGPPLELTKQGAKVTARCVLGAFGAGSWAKVGYTSSAAPSRSVVGWVAVDALDLTSAGSDPAQCDVNDWIYD